MTQTSSVIIVTVKPSVEYAKLCMSMCLGNARYSGRSWRRSAAGSARRCAWTTRFSTASDGHLRDQVAAQIEGGAARLTEARVSIMRRETKAGQEACTARRGRAASRRRARYAGGHGPPFAVNALLRYVRCPTLQQWQNRLSDSHRSRSIQVGGYVSLLH